MRKATSWLGWRPRRGVRERLSAFGATRGSLLVLAVLAIGPLFLTDNYALRLLVVSLLLGSQAMAFDFTVGFINIVNFGFAAFVGLGAYTSGLLAVRLGVSPWLGMLCGAASGGLLGFLIGALTLRLRGLYAAVLAWFAGLALMAAATAWVGLTRGNFGLSVPPLLDTVNMRPYYYALLPIAVVMYASLQAIARSHVGLAFRAIGQNLSAARASGVDPARYQIINFTVSCAWAGLLGGFHAHFVGTLTPSLMSSAHTIEVLAIAYIGGRGKIWGSLLAAFLIVPTFELLKSLMEVRLIMYGVLLILVMIAYPTGLAGLLTEAAQRLKKRVGYA